MQHSRPGHDPARRRFLGTAIGASALLAACSDGVTQDAGNAPAKSDDKPKADSALKTGVLLCGGNKIHPDTGDKVFVFTQCNIDLVVAESGVSDTNTRLITDIGFLAHGVINHPKQAQRIAVFEKKGPGGCEIDLKENRITRRIKPSDGCEFYGHGAYSSDAKVLYATEYDKESYAGKMVLRDTDDMKVIGEFLTHGEWPHDCQFIDDGKVVAITNGGGSIDGGAEPCVTYVSVPDGKLIERITFDNPLINAGHLLVSSKGDLAVAHAMREGYHGETALGALSLRPHERKFKTMVTPASVTGAMLGETLSIDLHEPTGIVAATNPYGERGGVLTFWNMGEQKYDSHLWIPQPRGVALSLDAKHWVVTFNKEKPAVILLDRANPSIDAATVKFECSSQGSHAYIHSYWA